MKKQGLESENKLKELFKSDFQEGVKRHQALLAQQKVLNETLEKMTKYHTRLETADKHPAKKQSFDKSLSHLCIHVSLFLVFPLV